MADNKPNAPQQPTIHVRQPPSEDTKTIRTNDPVTNEAERRLAMNEEEVALEMSKEQQKQQEEEAKRQQKEHDENMEFLQKMVKSPEGFVKREEKTAEVADRLVREGHAHISTVQSGPGGLEVEQRVMLTEKGYGELRTAFGPKMTK